MTTPTSDPNEGYRATDKRHVVNDNMPAREVWEKLDLSQHKSGQTWGFGAVMVALIILIVGVWLVKEVVFAPTTCVIGCTFESE